MNHYKGQQVAYTVHEQHFLRPFGMMWSSIAVFAIIGTVLAWENETFRGRVFLIICCCFFTLTTILLWMDLLLRCLIVMQGGKEFVYRTMFGRKRHFKIQDVSYVALGWSRWRGSHIVRIMNHAGKPICILETNMDMVDYLWKDFDKNRIPFRVE